MDSTEINVNKKSVKELLSSGSREKFVIPDYQRPYAWSEDEIETLFDDLWEATLDSINDKNSNKNFFLGSIVTFYNKDKNEQEIIDGQQRITTLFLLLRAIYSELSKNEKKNEKEENFINEISPCLWIKDKYTNNYFKDQILIDSKIIVNNEEFNKNPNEILKEILKDGTIQECAKDNYSKNFIKLKELYEKKAKEEPIKIYDFIFYILNNAILLPITTNDEDTALTIFSTLNDRGLPLSDADIFKAKIYNNLTKNKTTEKDLKQFIMDWKTLEIKANDVFKEGIQQLFYYYMFYLRAKRNDDKTTTPGLRKYFKDEKYQSLFDKELIPRLEEILNFWLVVNNRIKLENESWSTDLKILEILDCLKNYPNEFWKYPVIIYYLTYKNNSDFNDNFLKFLRRFYVFLIEKYIQMPTINAVKGDILKLDIKILSTQNPIFDETTYINSEEFKKALINPHYKIVRMLLLLLAYNNEKQDKLLPDKWEIEHIFPQSWNDNYIINISIDTLKERIEHLGNKLPFEKKLNIKASNGYFGKKKNEYMQSQISIVKDMSESPFEDWATNNIEARDKEITEEIQNTLITWINQYSQDKNVIQPTEEELRKIEEFRKKGFI